MKNSINYFLPLIRKVSFLTILFCLSLFIACSLNNSSNNEQKPIKLSSEEILENNTFRIDILHLDITYDYYPENKIMDGIAKITFKMRPNQTKALIHFNPEIRGNVINQIMLDNEVLHVSSEADVKKISFEETTQQALEFERELDAASEHNLIIDFTLNLTSSYPMFNTDVNDITGIGNEELFPTINTPQELMVHEIHFRVHSENEYAFIGSGYIEQNSSAGIQEWYLSTERPVASYTVMFVLVPACDVEKEERMVNGVSVKIMEFIGTNKINKAYEQLETWLPELDRNLGPFPMPRGLSVFLLSDGGGMEYFGGTISSLWALRHEVFHMYFGTSTIASTYRDSWWDEAINMWYQYSTNPNYPAISEDFRSDIVSGRTPVSIGFDDRAYDEGARIIQAVAERLGGRDKMIVFLSYVHQNHLFDPFTTIQLVDFIQDYSSTDMHTEFINWLYMGEQQYSKYHPVNKLAILYHDVQMQPPKWILDKYGINQKQ